MHSYVHMRIHVSEPGGSNPGGLSRSFRDGTRSVPNRCRSPGGVGSRIDVYLPSWLRGLRQPSTAIHVLNSHSPGPGGTVPDLRPMIHLILHCLFSPCWGSYTRLCRQHAVPQGAAHLSLGVPLGAHLSLIQP